MSYQKGYNQVVHKAVDSSDRQKTAGIGSRIKKLLGKTRRAFNGPSFLGTLSKAQKGDADNFIRAKNMDRAIKHTNRILSNRQTGARVGAAAAGGLGVGLGGAAGYAAGQRKTSSAGRQKTAGAVGALKQTWNFAPKNIARNTAMTGAGGVGGALYGGSDYSELGPVAGGLIGATGGVLTGFGGDLMTGYSRKSQLDGFRDFVSRQDDVSDDLVNELTHRYNQP